MLSRYILTLSVAATVVDGCRSLADAALVTAPSDLNVGDKYRLVFVTSTGRNAESGSIASYNAFVTSVAAGVSELATLGTTWTAIGSTDSVDARNNTGTNPAVAVGVPIYRTDGLRVANSNADLWDGQLLTSIQTTETGQVSVVPVWTGASSAGVGFPLGGELGSALNVTALGLSSSGSSTWINNSFATQNVIHAMYAMSGELTVVAGPGDLNLDRWVDIFDVGIVSENWGETGPPGMPGDADFSGAVNIFDVGIISENWNPPAGTSVPEPSSFFLAALGMLLLAARRAHKLSPV